MVSLRSIAASAVVLTLAWVPLAAQDVTSAKTVVTVVPKNGEAAPLQQANLKVWANGKKSDVTSWQPLRGDTSGLEFIVLIDDSARTGLGLQLDDLSKFINSLPPNAQVGIAYMRQGNAAIAQGLTPDHAVAVKALHLPMGIPGGNASPYFCLSDLAKRWPSQNPNNRREVLMVTDGVDRYNLRYDPSDPYLQAAITDSQRAGLIVYSIYYRDAGRIDRTHYETDAGQNLLTQLSQSTGGKLYGLGQINPVSFQPFLADISRRLENQYELGFSVPQKSKPGLVDFKVKSDLSHVSVDGPDKVPVGAAQ